MPAGFVARMADAAAPRGFDGISRWHSGPAGLIRFHHATTPEAIAEKQPLAGASGAVIAFDGRLDNRADLLALLGERGRELAGAPDVAIALAMFEVRGEHFLGDLVGDWAMAIWRPDARRLFCARSPMGWRPLLWSFENGVFGFATEPRALVVGLGLERRLDEATIGEFMAARFVTNTGTFWSGIERLEQGGALAFEKGRVRTWHWHDGSFEDLSRLSDLDHVDRFRAALDQALVATMRSATPVAAHLSGGLDSSTVVARATELHRAGRIDRQVIPVSARFPGEAQDEAVWSSAVEAHIGISARITQREPYRFDEMSQWCADTLQLPLRPSVMDSAAPGIRLQHANGERVLLTGEGGDDWFAGTLAHFPDMLLRGDLLGLYREAMSQFPGESAFVRLRRAGFLASSPVTSPRHRARFLWPHLVFDEAMPNWIEPEWARRVGLATRWKASAHPPGLAGYAQKQRYAVFVQARRHTAFEPILAFAESHGVEMRHPFHDLRVASFAMGASGRMLRRNGERKHVLREAMRGTLPEVVRTRQDKAIFISSLVDAIAERFRQRPPRELLPVKLGWIKADRITEMFAPALEWRKAGAQGPLKRGKLGPVWFVVATDLWLEHAVGL